MSCYVSMTSSFYMTDWISRSVSTGVIGKVITLNISLPRFILPKWIPNALLARTLDGENGNHRCLYIMTRILIYHQSHGSLEHVALGTIVTRLFATQSLLCTFYTKRNQYEHHWISFHVVDHRTYCTADCLHV